MPKAEGHVDRVAHDEHVAARMTPTPLLDPEPDKTRLLRFAWFAPPAPFSGAGRGSGTLSFSASRTSVRHRIAAASGS